MLLSVVGKLLRGRPKPNFTATTALTAEARRRRGATAMEYLAALSLIILVVMSAVSYFGQETKQTLQNSSDLIQNATQGSQQPAP